LQPENPVEAGAEDANAKGILGANSVLRRINFASFDVALEAS